MGDGGGDKVRVKEWGFMGQRSYHGADHHRVEMKGVMRNTAAQWDNIQWEGRLNFASAVGKWEICGEFVSGRRRG